MGLVGQSRIESQLLDLQINNPTELASVVTGPLHYDGYIHNVVQKPESTEINSVGSERLRLLED